MEYVALDTDVASKLLKRQLPPKTLTALAPYAPCITFVTLGELTEWAVARSWGQRSVDLLESWVATVPVIGYDDEVPRGVGSAVRGDSAGGPISPGQRHVERGLLSGGGTAPGDLERQGLPGLRRSPWPDRARRRLNREALQ
jgi:hypothetical protein